MSRPVVDDYLELLTTQRRAIARELRRVPEQRLWRRPAVGKWSPAEHLDHTRVLNKWFRRLFPVVWPFLLPLAMLRRSRPYPTTIDNPYHNPMPQWVGRIFTPRNSARRVPLATLLRGMAAEHRRIAAFYRARDARLLGAATFWDPLIGNINLIQALRIGAYHDQHHFDIVRRLLRDSA